MGRRVVTVVVGLVAHAATLQVDSSLNAVWGSYERKMKVRVAPPAC